MIIAYTKSGKMLGKTSKAWDVFVTKELMRGYELSFCIANSDPFRQLIAPDVVFEVEGQKYDITNFASSSGTDNITVVDAEHVSYRLNNYVLPEQYAFANNTSVVISTMLSVSGADAEFGYHVEGNYGGGSISLQNDEPISMRAAALAFKNANLPGPDGTGGYEVDYDNFTLRLARRVGADTGKVFKFGRDLVDLRRTWSKDNGATYDVDIAVLQRLEGGELEFGVGDDVTIEDAILGDTIKRRIISYTKCIDNPTLDKITLGVFIRDSADNSISMALDMQAMTEGVVKEGKPYNNVDISHEYGFRSVSGDGLMRTINNGTDGYKIQRLVSGVWRTVWEAESSTGKTIAYNLAGTRKVELGGTDGLKMYRLSGSTWIEVAGLNSAGQLATLEGLIADWIIRNNAMYALNNGRYTTLKSNGDVAIALGSPSPTITSGAATQLFHNGNFNLGNGSLTYYGGNIKMASSYAEASFGYTTDGSRAYPGLKLRGNFNGWSDYCDILCTSGGGLRLRSGGDSVTLSNKGTYIQLNDAFESAQIICNGEHVFWASGDSTYIYSRGDEGVKFIRNNTRYGHNGTINAGGRTLTFVNGICIG